MKKYLLYTLCAIALVACQKEVKNEQPVADGAPATFNVFSPETKTTIDGLSVKWAEGDKIRVYGHNTATGTYTDNGTYTLSSGAGTSAGVFTKDNDEALTGTYDAYYAVYPGNLTATVNGSTIVLPRLNSSPNHLRMQNPQAGQVDPNLAIMTAKFDGSKLVFRHGVGYIKVTIPTAGVTKVDINLNNSTACLADTPTYNVDSGALTTTVNSAKNVTSAEGSFAQGQSYYFAAVPRGSSYKVGDVIVTFTGGGTVSTSHFSGKDIEVGKVFDLGTPAIKTGPYFVADDVEIGAVETGGSITYIVNNTVTGGVVTSSILPGATISNLNLGTPTAGTLSFTCDKNEDTSNDKTATVRLTYTYNTSETVTKDVIITQIKAGVAVLTPIASTKTWDAAHNWSPLATAKGTSTLSETFIDDNLQYVCSGKIKFNAAYLRFDGTGSASEKCVQFKIGGPGTLTVNAKSAKDTATDRTVKIAQNGTVNTTNVFTVPSGSDSSESHDWTITTASSGDVISVFSGNSGINVYSITWTPAE